jgi:hypothetical protein
VPLEVPWRVRLSAKLGSSLRLRLGGCLAAEERRRRWPAEASKDDWEASVTGPAGEAARNVRTAAARGWRRQVDRAEVQPVGGCRHFALDGVALQER